MSVGEKIEFTARKKFESEDSEQEFSPATIGQPRDLTEEMRQSDEGVRNLANILLLVQKKNLRNILLLAQKKNLRNILLLAQKYLTMYRQHLFQRKNIYGNF